MVTYNPPINERDTDQLIQIAYSKNDEWQLDAINQAKKELQKRNISKEYQIQKLNQWDKDLKQFEIEYLNKQNSNFNKSYNKLDMIKIFLLAPLILTGKSYFDTGFSLINLWKENYKTKFKQRFILLVLGMLFWISVLFMVFKYSEYLRMKEIQKSNISDWEKNRITDVNK